MTSSTARQTFRELVAAVAAKARAKLPPAVNGRIESAVKLVLLHDVMPQADGSILVGSSSDAMKSYLLVGTTCECQDFTRGQAPDGWCAHRIAAGMHRRVQEMTARSTPVETETAPDAVGSTYTTPLPEAPASCNVFLTISGHKVQVTLRDGDEHRMLTRLQTLLQQYPVPQAAPQAASTAEGWCPKHDVHMTQSYKAGRSWWSHKTPEGWCKGKP